MISKNFANYAAIHVEDEQEPKCFYILRVPDCSIFLFSFLALSSEFTGVPNSNCIPTNLKRRTKNENVDERRSGSCDNEKTICRQWQNEGEFPDENPFRTVSLTKGVIKFNKRWYGERRPNALAWKLTLMWV